MKEIKSTTNIKNIIINYVRNNIKEYILISTIFIIGLLIGVIFINNCSEEKANIISEYITEFMDKFKQTEQIDKTNLYSKSLKNNVLLTLLLWLSGTTIIGIPVVLGIILYRGFCLGVTVSSISMTLGVGKGIWVSFIMLGLQSIIFVPAIITIGVSSLKLYKSIIADRRKENIKVQVLSHTIISFLMFLTITFSSFVENEIALRLLSVGT